MAKFEIVMIGNTAVGKTSMLSVLSRELKKFNKAGKLQFKPTSAEFDVLDDKWNDLLKQIAQSDEWLPVTSNIGATPDFIEHPFEFSVEGKKKCDVVFVDSPGAFTKKRNDDLVDRVNNAFGVFCVVDAAVMMACPEWKSNELNRPAAIEEILNKVFTDGDGKQPRFVSFILTKCEKWMTDEKGRRNLAKKFHACFDQTISMLKDADNPPCIDMLAIQTMGCVRFAELNENEEPVFMLVDKGLKPKDCAYPLILMLRYLIKALAENTTIWGKILIALGLDTDLRAYLSALDDKCVLPQVYEEL